MLVFHLCVIELSTWRLLDGLPQPQFYQQETCCNVVPIQTYYFLSSQVRAERVSKRNRKHVCPHFYNPQRNWYRHSGELTRKLSITQCKLSSMSRPSSSVFSAKISLCLLKLLDDNPVTFSPFEMFFQAPRFIILFVDKFSYTKCSCTTPSTRNSTFLHYCPSPCNIPSLPHSFIFPTPTSW